MRKVVLVPQRKVVAMVDRVAVVLHLLVAVLQEVVVPVPWWMGATNWWRMVLQDGGGWRLQDGP